MILKTGGTVKTQSELGEEGEAADRVAERERVAESGFPFP